MRKRRQLKDGATYHVIGRVNRKEFILNSPVFKELLLQVLREAKVKYAFHIKNFCIMGNHFHLILKPLNEQSLSRIMQWILSVFAIRYNKIIESNGHVWYDRFKSKIIRSFMQYIKTFIYIATNPVRSNLVTQAVDFHYNGISYIQKGKLDILERPSNSLLKIVWPIIRAY
ncbi:MAG: transposase [Spirochaetes bacterium]|nr:MAG: transposase [Spirochaetota bacterium]